MPLIVVTFAKESDENSHHLENRNSSAKENDESLDNDYGHSCHVDAPIPKSDISSSLTDECVEACIVMKNLNPADVCVPWLFSPRAG